MLDLTGSKVEVVIKGKKENQTYAPEQLYDLQKPAEFEDTQCLASSRTANHLSQHRKPAPNPH
jgi:hypothetical protein